MIPYPLDAGLTPIRQIFIQQPNRDFTRCLIITELSFRLFHFDRSGIYVTPWMDINKDARTFVRLVIGLSTTEEKELGLDTSVQWSIDKKTGLKESGTVYALNEYGKRVKYELDMEKPPFIRTTIRGRGTVCWYAFDPETRQKVVIKDAWREAARRPESEYLEAALTIPGIAKLISWEDNRAQTQDPKYRPAGMAAVCDNFFNHLKSRIVVRASGRPLNDFKTRHEVVAAFRDVISGESLSSFVLRVI